MLIWMDLLLLFMLVVFGGLERGGGERDTGRRRGRELGRGERAKVEGESKPRPRGFEGGGRDSATACFVLES